MKKGNCVASPTKLGLNFDEKSMLKSGSKVYGIIRVSTKKQVDKTSLLHQERSIRTFCKYKGYELIRIYKEAGRSAFGTLEKRKELQQMMNDAEYDNVDGVIFFDLSRASRNPKEYDKFKDWLRDKGLSMEFVTQSFANDIYGDFTEDVLVRVAKLQSQASGQKAREGMRDRVVINGIHMGNPPLGYKRAGKEAKIKSMLIPSRHYKFVVQAWKMYLNKKGIYEIYEYLRKNDVRNFQNRKPSLKAVYNLFTKQAYFYGGKVKWHDEYHKGCHKPIINAVQWQKVKRLQSYNKLKSLQNLPNYKRTWIYGKGFESKEKIAERQQRKNLHKNFTPDMLHKQQ